MQRYLFFFFLVTAMLLGGCGTQTANYIDFGMRVPLSAAHAADTEGERPLRIAVATVMSSNVTIDYYREIAQYIAEELGRPTVVVQRKTYDEVNLLMASGDADIAFMSTGAYCSYRGINQIDVLAMAEFEGKKTYSVQIITRGDHDAIHSLSDLAGKTFAFTDPLSYSGHVAVVSRLMEHGYSQDTFFSRCVYTHSHDKSLLAVRNKAVDAACIDSQIYDYSKRHTPQMMENIRILEEIGSVPTGPVVIQHSMSDAQKAELRDIFFSMHESDTMRKSMQGLFVDSFVAPETELYEPIRAVYDKIGAHGL